jgi:hypothetical protein
MRVVAVLGAALVTGLLTPIPATAGEGSLISGVAWADTDRDGVRQAEEILQEGVTVELLSSPGGAVVATTTTDADGSYSFADAADGDYTVRVTAPGAFEFPDTAGGDNDFASTGPPPPGEPEQGASTTITVDGDSQHTDIDAGMQPVADLAVARLPIADSCEGFASTGTPPFDDNDDPGNDSGTGNCIVRVGDTVTQNYSVALTGLPTGAEVENVVAEFTISSPDGGVLELVGPGAEGMPAGCLSAAQGVDPSSSVTVNPDGSITVLCNLGTMSSNVAAVQLAYRFAGDTPVPAHASIEMHAFAAGGDAGTSNTVEGPEVEVTGTGQWDLEKIVYPSTGTFQAGPDFTVQTFDGAEVEGYLVRYQFNITDITGGDGGSDLVWPVTFTDVLPEFPNARITECRSTINIHDQAGASPWTLTCPLGEVQGADGWELSIQPDSGVGSDTGEGHMVMTVFVPLEEMNTAIDPTWQDGDPTPSGEFDFENQARDTDHWTINGGALNFGDGREPGWDGTGNNLAVIDGESEPAQWDLIKTFQAGPDILTRDIDGVEVDGVDIVYRMQIVDLTGPDNIAPWLDRPVTFDDRLVSHPGAILIACTPLTQGSPLRANGEPTCEPEELQPADGWNMSWEPNPTGFERRRGDFFVRIFIPMDDIEGDICETDVTLDLRNEAINTEHWTAAGQPNNGTGFEPGWDGTEATGNNLDERSIRPSASQCGSLTGNKNFIQSGLVKGQTFGGDISQSFVSLAANNNRVVVDDLRLCDVFDVSVFQLVEGTPRMGTFPSGNNVDPADYVIEYAEGPNEVDTQFGPIDENGLFPIDASSLSDAATDCRDHAGPWSTDPEADFGADWQDSVNMVRLRPIDPDHVATGPFAAHLIFELETRTFYNGGPNAGEVIPSGVRTTNVGAWPTGITGEGWTTVERAMRFLGMRLTVGKTVTPTQYLPGAQVVWDLHVGADRTTVGATLLNLQVVDTIPEDLHFDLACTQDLLPEGVTVSYDATTRQATFQAGDIEIVDAPTQSIFHSTTGAPRLRICTTVDSLAQPLDTLTNHVQAFADNSENAPEAEADVQVVGAGQMGISKSVDKPFVASGEDYTWSLRWGNTSTFLAFQNPDVIDVLPWNGDGADDALSRRDQFETDFTGTAQLSGPLPQPEYVRGETGEVAGTWYYATADPASINHDPRDASNADPQAPGGLWLTEGEIADFGDVTAVRFVSDEFLNAGSHVEALIPAVSVSNDLDNVYVNRAMIFSETFEDQPLLSNEPFVLMPGFTLGDLVWRDDNGDGIFNNDEEGIPGVAVEVLDENGDVVGTATTDADGRWLVDRLPEGTYRVRVPGTVFDTGGPLEGHEVSTVGSSASETTNETGDNNNTETPDPVATGLVSTPVTLAYIRDDDGNLIGANGPIGDNVAGLGNPLIPDAFTNFTVDLAATPRPDVDIEKATNTVDADEAPGPLVLVGDPVVWTFVVTNTGRTRLSDITVTDDQIDAADIDCGDGTNVVAGPLARDESFTCTATGVAAEGPYENTGTVTATNPSRPNAPEVTDEDPSHHEGVEPEVDIEKATNTIDADEAPGPLVAVGDPVVWTYVVTNTGNADLTDVTVTDDQIDASEIDCGDGTNVVAGPLAPDDSFTCTATGVAAAGEYANTGTVVGDGPETTDENGDPVPPQQVSDEDPSHHTGVEPAVDIEKSTNTFDADEAPGPLVAVGGSVVWEYVVTNTGDTDLTNITVTDDQLDAADIDCGDGTNVVAGPLAPDDSFTCTATGVAAAGPYENTGTVVGDGPETVDENGDPAPQQVSDEDPSHHEGVEPAVDIEKSTNDVDADEAPGPLVTVGDPVTWTYVVTNTGNAELTNVTVTDDQIDASDIDCGDGTNVVAGPLAPDDSFTCTATGVAAAGQYENTGMVVGDGPETTDENGEPVPPQQVNDEDPSHHFGADANVDIEKSTNTVDADEAPGPLVAVGDPVVWSYVVTNTGNVELTNITVTDDQIDASEIDCGDGSNVVAGPLAPDDSFTCTAQGVAEDGQYENTGTVVGDAPDGSQPSDEDPSHHTGVEPAVDIEKSTNTVDADEPTGPLVLVGNPVRWTYVVTNTGNTDLTDVTVTDDQIDASEIDCGDGTNVVAGPLAPDESFTCTATGVAAADQYENTGEVVGDGPETTDENGDPVPPQQVSDEDPSHHFGAAPAVDIEKSTNGEDADQGPGPSLGVGELVTWTYVVTNTGNVELTNVTVTDDQIDASEIDCGDGTNVVAGPLEPDGTFTCTAQGVAAEGQYENTGSVVGDAPATVDENGDPVPPGECLEIVALQSSGHLSTGVALHVLSTQQVQLASATVCDDDPSHYNAATLDEDGELVSTGRSIVGPLTAGLIVLLAGVLLLLRVNRRRSKYAI